MNKLQNQLLLFLLIFYYPQAYAAGSDYKCTIERYSVASGDEGEVYESYRKIYLGKKFIVEKKSGLMAGVLKNSYFTEPQVIDYGSSENSYKVVTIMSKQQGAGAGSNIYALTINEFEKTRNKNFVFMQNDEVFFGKCINY